MKNRASWPWKPGRLFNRLFPSGEGEPFFAALDEAREHVEPTEGQAAARRSLFKHKAYLT